MTSIIKIVSWAVCFCAFVSVVFFVEADATGLQKKKTLRIAIVGDTGIGKRGFFTGFINVMSGVREKQPDVFLHLGDFVYQDEKFSFKCRKKHKRAIRRYLVTPFPKRIFVPGDNDLPPVIWKPKASGCWEYIDTLDEPFDKISDSKQAAPGPYEGTLVVGNTMFAVLNAYHKTDPGPWLKPRIDRAREKGFWVIVAVHEPPVTTAWFHDKFDRELTWVNRLEPDLVFSGNQHSYERFHSIGIPNTEGALPVSPDQNGVYQQDAGSIHIISGGGGAIIKPFADLQHKRKRTAPKEVFAALATRALMNHFLILEVTSDSILGKTYRVCSDQKKILKKGKSDPRWKHKKKFWKKIKMTCDGVPPGITLFDQFQIQKGYSLN